MSIEPESSEPTDAGLTSAEEASSNAWAQQIERDDYEPRASDHGVALEGGEAAAYSRALLEDLLGADALNAAIGRGRPSLSGGRRGESPKRQVRLPADLDARLLERAAAEETTASAIIRRAIDMYLEAQGVLGFVDLVFPDIDVRRIDPAPLRNRAARALDFAERLTAADFDTRFGDDDREELATLLRSLSRLAELEARTLQQLHRAD